MALRSYKLWYNYLALSRTRIFTAVMSPALIGAAYAGMKDEFILMDFIFIAVGLISAELLNLFAYDYKALTIEGYTDENPLLPGSPVFSEKILPAKRIPVLLGFTALIGLSVLVYFIVKIGLIIVVLMGAAIIIGGLYVRPPFPYAYLSTSLLPPVLSGGVYLALSGNIDINAFLAGLPVTWISVAVILNYRVLYDDPEKFSWGKAAVVISFYLLAFFNIALFIVTDFLPPLSAIAAGLAGAGILKMMDIFKKEKEDSIPATSLGVMIHSGAALVIALSFLL